MMAGLRSRAISSRGHDHVAADDLLRFGKRAVGDVLAVRAAEHLAGLPERVAAEVDALGLEFSTQASIQAPKICCISSGVGSGWFCGLRKTNRNRGFLDWVVIWIGWFQGYDEPTSRGRTKNPIFSCRRPDLPSRKGRPMVRAHERIGARQHVHARARSLPA